ncbi:hypothetical protein JYK02_39300 [Corallococcus macrosporus]|uniref:Outer membrane protein beta-barrel domain-containing protein n=1 Tax=Corallococcus macrosporus TaxID=35 RepID=A0ABS3DQJ2_9BACT|nr:outer membrane beta-barrel protein [Corallococcus macrosporus]MBN8233586.1 hypothetical protein [Corallococcus macrosporus]
MPRSPPALTTLLFFLAATAARAEDPAPLQGPWVGVTLSTSSAFDAGIREAGLNLSTVEYESSVGLGVRAGYDVLSFAGAYAELQADVHYTSFGGGLRLLTPTRTLRAGLSAGLRFLPQDPTLPFFTAGLLAEVRPWEHLAFGLEVGKAWPLKDEVTRDQQGATPQRTLTLDEGPLRVVLGLTWYF